VTWLYGPLQTDSEDLTTALTQAGRGMSESNLVRQRKSILKKQSLLDIILGQSPCFSSPIKPTATALAIEAEETDPSTLSQESSAPRIGIAIPDKVTFLFTLRPITRDNSSEFSLVSLSKERLAPTNERRQVHFTDEVDQCVAVDIEVGGNCEERGEVDSIYDDDSSSDDGLMMKPSSRLKIPNSSIGSSSCSSDSNSAANSSIAMLPPTVLKHQNDFQEPGELELRQGSEFWSSEILSRPLQDYSWQLTSKGSFDSVGETADMLRKPSSALANHRDMIAIAHGVSQQNAYLDGDEEYVDLRSAINGMFGHQEGDEGGVGKVGHLGWIAEAVNTAKDMAYVLWNVRWI
jgi:hypothetical protein